MTRVKQDGMDQSNSIKEQEKLEKEVEVEDDRVQEERHACHESSNEVDEAKLVSTDMSGFLPRERFYQVVESTQITSVDLIIRNPLGKYLFGTRKNSPAKGYLFVPGGRVFKRESIPEAVLRIMREEVGIPRRAVESIEPMGVYEHVYQDNFADQTFGTHYVVHAYEIIVKTESSCVDAERFHSQHDDKSPVWLYPIEILNPWVFVDTLPDSKSKMVHQFCQFYFQTEPPPNLVMVAQSNSYFPKYSKTLSFSKKTSLNESTSG